VASDQQLVGHVAADYVGGRIVDIQVEVYPLGLGPVLAVGAIVGRGRAAPVQAGSSLGSGRAGGAIGHGQAGAHGGPTVGCGGAGERQGGAAKGQGRAGC